MILCDVEWLYEKVKSLKDELWKLKTENEYAFKLNFELTDTHYEVEDEIGRVKINCENF